MCVACRREGDPDRATDALEGLGVREVRLRSRSCRTRAGASGPGREVAEQRREARGGDGRGEPEGEMILTPGKKEEDEMTARRIRERASGQNSVIFRPVKTGEPQFHEFSGKIRPNNEIGDRAPL